MRFKLRERSAYLIGYNMRRVIHGASAAQLPQEISRSPAGDKS